MSTECYKCVAQLPHLFHDDGKPRRTTMGYTNPYGTPTQVSLGSRGNRDTPVTVVSGERITDELARSMRDGQQEQEK